MADIILLTLSLFCLVLGVFGSVLPVLPGPPLSWIGLFIFKYTSFCDYNWTWIIITAVIVIAVSVLDYVLPSWGTKKMGGSKYGIWGASVGLIIGLIFSPFGLLSIIIAPFLGAFLGEYIFYKKDKKGALKAAFGSFLGFLMSTGLGLMVSIGILVMVLINLFGK